MSQTGFNSKLFHMSGTAGTEITGLISLDVPPQEYDMIDVTHLQSAAKEYIAGVKDAGELTGECLYTDARYQQLNGYANGAVHNWKIEFGPADTLTATFAGLLKSQELSLKFDEASTIKFTIQVSGDVTLA